MDRSVIDEASYVCDACGEDIVVPVDVTQGERQTYVEDCPVCCGANVLYVDVDREGRVDVRAQAE